MAWTALAGAAVSSAGTTFGQGMANKATSIQNRKMRNWNEKMWHMENAYNTPEATMQRYRDAGLNPNLVVGEGAIGGGQAGSVGGVPPPEMKNVMEGFDPIGDYMNLKNQELGIEAMKSENELKTEKVNYQRIINDLTSEQLTGARYQNDATRDDYANKRAQEKIRTGFMLNQNLLQKQQWNRQSIEIAWLETEKIFGLAKTKADISLINNKIKLNDQEWSFIKKNNYRIPTKIMGGLFTKYIMNNVQPEKRKLILKTVKEVVQGFWKNNTGENSWRNPNKTPGVVPNEEQKNMFEKNRERARMGPGYH